MKKLAHKFVEFVPRPLEDDVLYISVRFRIATHKCCCGCGNEVATNLSPRGWQLVYDGETVSLYPSIGNWNFKCKSHYWITNDTVQWAESWSERKIRLARETDEKALKAIDETSQGQADSNKETGLWAVVRRKYIRRKNR